MWPLFQLVEILEIALGNLALSKPSLLYLSIAAVTAINAAILWRTLRRANLTKRLWASDSRIDRVRTGILWIGFGYLILRFPIAAFAVPPAGLGRWLIAFVMYSLLFGPLWIGLVVLAWKLTRRAAGPNGSERAVLVLAGFCSWGTVGELRMLLDPALIDRLGRI